MIKAVIFDLDGVLVDAVDIHYQAFQKAIHLFGFSVPPVLHNSVYNGLPTSSKLEMLTQTFNLPRGLHAFINEMKQKYTQEALEKTLIPSQIQISMLKDLKAHGYQLAVASNCTRQTVDLVLQKLHINRFFDVVLSREEIARPKPDPEIYRKCLELLKVRDDECLILEDSKPGLIAAQGAASHVVQVRSVQEVTLPWIKNRILASEQKSFPEPETIEIIIPMAGLGSRFQEAGYPDPKPFIPVLGKPMIQWVIDNLNSRCYRTRFTFVVNKTHFETYEVEKRLLELAPGSHIIPIPGYTEGAACTVRLAMDHIPSDRPLVLANSDQYVDLDFDAFLCSAMLKRQDGLIMTFPANESKWSYAKTDAQGSVIQVAEKEPISNDATVGIYFFRRADLFTWGCEAMIRKNIRTNGEFYACPVYNELIQAGKTIGIFSIPSTSMHGLGTPEDLNTFIDESPQRLTSEAA
ncbi:HAD family hydrolase [bacterium]|nr:HAD family hydrolase [bacterium]